MIRVRFFDWNSLLGSLVFVILCLWMTLWSLESPADYYSDDRASVKLLPIAGLIISLIILFRITVFIEFGEQISFVKIFRIRRYDWAAINSAKIERRVTRFIYGLGRSTNDYLVVTFGGGSQAIRQEFRLSGATYSSVVRLFVEQRPDLEIFVMKPVEC